MFLTELLQRKRKEFYLTYLYLVGSFPTFLLGHLAFLEIFRPSLL